MLGPPQLKAPRAAMPGPGWSSRNRASYGLSVQYSATPPNAGTPAGAVHRCPTFRPFTPTAAVSDSQASASVPATGTTNPARIPPACRDFDLDLDRTAPRGFFLHAHDGSLDAEVLAA